MSLSSGTSILPHIDADPTPAALSAADALIQSELDATTTPSAPHPSLPALRPSVLTPTLAATLDTTTSSSSSTDRAAISRAMDLTRYASTPLPASADTPTLTAALRAAHTNAAYLAHRTQALGLLETYGRHAWLVGNAGLEDALRGLEREVVGARDEGMRVEGERRGAMEAARAEVVGLEDGWREGVRRVLVAQVAGEKVAAETRERLRMLG